MELITLLYFAYAILGIGIVIFIHELGHFLAAKKVGVRVETFCLGFDPAIRGRRLRFFSFKKGETTYAVGAIPFGGYVKMAGETVLERKKDSPPPKSDELLGKPPGARALVFAAGAIFNILSAVVFFIFAFRIGVNLIAPEIGQVEPGQPAWEAGLQPGDRVLEINGKKVDDFHEVAIACALGTPDVPRTFVIQRGERTLPPINITPAWSPEMGFHAIGVTPAVDPAVRSIEDNSPAARAGIQEGDRIVGLRLKGIEIEGPHLQYLREFLMEHPGTSFQLGVERPGDGTILWKDMRLEPKPSETSNPLLGVMPAPNVVEAIRPGSRAQKILSPGDRILTIQDQPVASMDWLPLRDTFGLEGSVVIEIQPLTGKIRKVTEDIAELIRWSLRRDVQWGNQGCQVLKVLESSPLTGKLEKGDVVVAVGSEKKPIFKPAEFSQWAASQGNSVVFWYRRNLEVFEYRGELKVPQKADLGLEWNSTPPVRVFPNSPAAQAGIQSGSKILEIGGQPILSYVDLQSAVKQSDPEAMPVQWIPPGGGDLDKPQKAVVNRLSGQKIQNHEGLGIGLLPLQVNIQTGILDSFALGAKRTVVVAQNVFLTLKGLISRQVEAKNLAGPVGIINLIYRVSEYGIGTLIYYLALISVNLGLFNLLPFPILDGGHLLFLAIEKIKGSPVDVRIQEIVTTVAFFLIIGLALFVTYNDLVRLISR